MILANRTLTKVKLINSVFIDSKKMFLNTFLAAREKNMFQKTEIKKKCEKIFSYQWPNCS